MMETHKIIVAAYGYNGPDLFFVKVFCSQEDCELGNHYQGAEAWATNEGLDGPFVSFDENDPLKPMFDFFCWDTATVVDIHGEEVKA